MPLLPPSICAHITLKQFAELTCLAWTSIQPLWACGSTHLQTHEHHLGTIRAPTCQRSLSVTSIAAEGGRLAKGWVLVNWAVKISDVSGLFKRQNGSRAEATSKTQEGCHDARRWGVSHYSMLSHQENIFRFFSHYHLKWPGSYEN